MEEYKTILGSIYLKQIEDTESPKAASDRAATSYPMIWGGWRRQRRGEEAGGGGGWPTLMKKMPGEWGEDESLGRVAKGTSHNSPMPEEEEGKAPS